MATTHERQPFFPPAFRGDILICDSAQRGLTKPPRGDQNPQPGKPVQNSYLLRSAATAPFPYFQGN